MPENGGISDVLCRNIKKILQTDGTNGERVLRGCMVWGLNPTGRQEHQRVNTGGSRTSVQGATWRARSDDLKCERVAASSSTALTSVLWSCHDRHQQQTFNSVEVQSGTARVGRRTAPARLIWTHWMAYCDTLSPASLFSPSNVGSLHQTMVPTVELQIALSYVQRSFIVGQKQVSGPSFSQQLTDLDEI